MISETNTKVRYVRCSRCRVVLKEPPEIPLYKCGGCDAVLQAKKPKEGTVDAALQRLKEDSVVKPKVEQLSDDKEGGNNGLNQELLAENELDRNSDHNEARSSTELSCQEDPESSPEAGAHIDRDQENHLSHQHNTMDKDQDQEQDQDQDQDQGQNQDQNQYQGQDQDKADQDQDQEQEQEQGQEQEQDQDQDPNDQEMYMTDGVSENCKDGAEFGESSRFSAAISAEKYSSSEHSFHEVEEPSKVFDKDSSFKSLIAEKLLETGQKKEAMNEDDILSEDETADLSHHKTVRRFERVNSVETLENVRFGNTVHYGYEGSVSSFDGKDEVLHSRKIHGGSKGLPKRDELRANNIPNGDGRRAKWRHEVHPHRQWGKDTMMRLEKDKHRYIHGNASPSRPRFNDRYEDPKLKKFELLKMVQELQDQLDRTTVSNAPQFPPYHVPSYPRYPPRYGQRMAFSGEATTGVYSPCHHCHPQDRHFSAQLPAQLICRHHEACCSSHCSGHPSPQHHLRPEFSGLTRTEKIPDIPKPYLREKHRSPKKRHVRPISGGAPFITCYWCSEILQMPQSFLLFKRRYHSLTCGACSKVLSFTLVNGSQIARYYPEEMIAAPPSSEVDDYADSRPSQVEPVSCSDRSFQKSYSTETENVGRLNSTDRKLSHGSGKAVMSRDRENRSTDQVPSSDLAVASSSKISARKKVTSEIEEIEPAPPGYPLHRLMGYASPSKVIRG